MPFRNATMIIARERQVELPLPREAIVNGKSLAEQLETRVVELLDTYASGSFQKYWGYYKESVAPSDVKAFFVKLRPSENYLNVAVIGEGLLIDVDGDDAPESGGIGVHPLTSVRSVYVRTNPPPTLPRARTASLVVFTQLAGGTGGPYWFAEDSEEERDLLRFSKILLDSIKVS